LDKLFYYYTSSSPNHPEFRPDDRTTGPIDHDTRQAIQERFADHPDVKDMKREIERLQRELENAVAAGRFDRAALFRDERRRVERSLWELYRKLS
jgi:hypothetical protein